VAVAAAALEAAAAVWALEFDIVKKTGDTIPVVSPVIDLKI
jgi:hypothetical protein